jgi:Txe/YoeB family toxin of Txe-Axe toxin-antitoxin module
MPENFSYEEEMETFIGKISTMNFNINGPEPLESHQKYSWSVNINRSADHEVLHSNEEVGIMEYILSNI